jgi:phage terminase large subunit-like protein
VRIDPNEKLDRFIAVQGPGAPIPSANPKNSESSSDAPEDVEEGPSAEEINAEPEIVDGVKMPREWSARYRLWSAEQRAEWRSARNECRTNPLTLSGAIGLDLVPLPHAALFAQLLTFRGEDKDGCWTPVPFDQLDPKHKRMVLWSRGTCKTTSIRVVMIQAMLNYPNIRICFLTGGDKLAKLQLAALKQHLEHPTEEFLHLFPEYCTKSIQNKKGDWHDIPAIMGNSQQFTIPCRSTVVFAEPTFKISTARSVKSGGHFSLLVADDLVNDQNYQNSGALEKCYQSYVDTIPLLEPTGFLVMTGTRYSFGDTYERIQESAQTVGDLSNWHFSIRGCWSKGICECRHAECFHDPSINIAEPPCQYPACACQGFTCSAGLAANTPNSDVLFPMTRKRNGEPFGHTKTYLLGIKAEDERAFACQYLNQPIAAFEQQFSEALIGAQTIFDPNMMPPFLAPTYIVGDPAFTAGSENRDESCLWVFRVWLGAYWFFDCIAGRWASNELVENILKLIRMYKPTSVFLEKTAASDAINNLLIARAPDFNMYGSLPIVWTTPSNRKDAKMLRIGAAQSWLIGKRVWIYRNMLSDPQAYDKLVLQLVRFPRNGKHDDRADAFAMALEAPIALGTALQNTSEQQQAEAKRKQGMPYIWSNDNTDDDRPYPPLGQ